MVAAQRTRVAIPLHGSRRWLDVVEANVRRLAGGVALTVSDASGDDDSLAQLQRRLADVPGIEWLGPRPIPRGWVPHCNDLLQRSTDEFFAWLPHDDDVGLDWFARGEAALSADPGAILALGGVVPVVEVGVTRPGYEIAFHPPFSDPDDAARLWHAVEVAVAGDTSLLGAPFRGVMRRASAVPLPSTSDRDEGADVLWSVRMLARGRFTRIPATYGKRWHGDSARKGWRHPRDYAEFRTRWLPEALADLPQPVREELLLRAWALEVSALGEQHERVLEASLDALRGDFARSRSWRLTAPLRRFSDILRRRRG